MYSTNPIKLVGNYIQNRLLIKQLVYKEVVGKHRGTHLGILWVVLEPLLMLAVYTFVFRIIFKRYWYSSNESIFEFSIILFSGLLIFNYFRDVISSAPQLIIKNSNYVKKVVFPLEILSGVSIFSGFINLCVSMIILATIHFLAKGQFYWAMLYVPIILIPYIFILLGASFFLASLGVYLRDVGQIIGLVVMATLFLSAIFYPFESVPERYRILFYLNPVAYTVEQFRGIMIWGRSPQLYWLMFYYPGSMLIGWLGFYWFQKTRKGFADVL